MFQLGKYEYASKEDLKTKLKVYLATAPEGIILHVILIEKLQLLLMLHPRAEEKTGSGVKQFVIIKNKRGSGKGFMVVRNDGTEKTFSYKKCIDGQTVTNRAKVIEAFRFSIRQQLMDFRKTIELPAVCGISGRAIETNAKLQIDHKVPFWKLLMQFYCSYSVDINFLETKGGGEYLELVDKNVESQFQDFHRKYAVLQPSLKEENQKKAGRI